MSAVAFFQPLSSRLLLSHISRPRKLSMLPGRCVALLLLH